jgi:hypothetical protein
MYLAPGRALRHGKRKFMTDLAAMAMLFENGE